MKGVSDRLMVHVSVSAAPARVPGGCTGQQVVALVPPVAEERSSCPVHVHASAETALALRTA